MSEGVNVVTALVNVLGSWVNGRKVADGIPMTVLNEAKSALSANLWTKNRPTAPGWYWAKLCGSVTQIRISECDLLFGGRPELRHVTAWQGPIVPNDTEVPHD